jgi:hypothetical protein
MWARRVSLAGALLATLASARGALAFPSSRLVYARGEGAQRCPEETALRREVAARLGYDPFFPAAERTIVVVVAAEGVDLKAKVFLIDTSGVVQGLREFNGPAERCAELVHAAALSISIAIDPAQADAAASPPVPPRQEPTPEGPISAAVEPQALPTRPERPREHEAKRVPHEAWHWAAGAGTVGAIGATPVGTFGGVMYGSARLGRASLTLELRGDLPSTIDEPRYRFSSVGINAVPCLHWDPLFSCLVETASRFSAEGLDPRAPSGQSGLYLATGVRGSLELSLLSGLRLRLHADLLASLLQVRVSSGGRDVWRAAPVSASAGAALAFHF